MFSRVQQYLIHKEFCWLYVYACNFVFKETAQNEIMNNLKFCVTRSHKRMHFHLLIFQLVTLITC